MTTIPFYPNHPDNMHCSQAVFRSLFEYYFDQKLSWEEIDAITKTIPSRGSWTMAAYSELARRGLSIINIEPFEYDHFFSEGIHYLENRFSPQTVQYYLNSSNLLSIREDIPEFLKLVDHQSRKPTITDIDTFLEAGCLVGAEINSGILNQSEELSLHYVLVYAKNSTSYFINDPGFPPHEKREVNKQLFYSAFGTDRTNGEVTAICQSNPQSWKQK